MYTKSFYEFDCEKETLVFDNIDYSNMFWKVNM